jgi:hypothetical protein
MINTDAFFRKRSIIVKRGSAFRMGYSGDFTALLGYITEMHFLISAELLCFGFDASGAEVSVDCN